MLHLNVHTKGTFKTSGLWVNMTLKFPLNIIFHQLFINVKCFLPLAENLHGVVIKSLNILVLACCHHWSVYILVTVIFLHSSLPFS